LTKSQSVLKNRIQKLLLTNYLLILTGIASSQQLPLYSQYMMNGFLLNPAMAGCDGYTTLNLTARDQWAGFENSPKTYALSLQSRILRRNYKIKGDALSSVKKLNRRSGRVGLGAYVYNDQNGIVNQTGGQIAYSYHIFLNNTQLSFGLAASTYQFSVDQDKLTFRADEPLISQGFDNLVFVPDFTFGAYLLNYKSFLGISAAQLLKTNIKIGENNINYKTKRHFYLMGGHRFDIKNDLELEPSFLIKGSELGFVQADINMKLYYKEFYWVGLSYRTQSSIGLLIGGRQKRFYFGYAFDYTLNNIRKYTFGSHELNIAIKFGDSSRRYRWLIRY
jgi:type IX secretion system PorP/SprF family membrane protein